MAEDTQRVVTNFADLLTAHRKIHRKLICCYEIILALLFLIQNSRSENYWKIFQDIARWQGSGCELVLMAGCHDEADDTS